MGATIKVARVDVVDTGADIVYGDVHIEVASDDAVLVGIGAAVVKHDVRRVSWTRAAFDTFVAAGERDKADSWNDAAIPHPIAKGT